MAWKLAKAGVGRLRSCGEKVDATADDKRYRRGQRRRALVAWGTLGVVAALVVLGIVFGGEEKSAPPPTIHLFTYEMSSDQYRQLHKGEGELAVLRRSAAPACTKTKSKKTTSTSSRRPRAARAATSGS
jgi:hypothetical protein